MSQSTSLLDFLNEQRFRNLLLDAHNGSILASNQLRDLIRLLAAYFLDLPLFLPEIGESLPTLFVWCDLKKEALPPTTRFVDREAISLHLFPQFGPKSPILILIHLGLPLEAILYADHFSDIRSGLILRIFTDASFGFSLTTDHIYYLLHEGIPEEIDRLLSRIDSSPKEEIERLSETIGESILQLDVVLGTSRISAFELFLLGKIEFIFARLPVHCSTSFAKMLPRPPVFSIPNVSIGSPKREDFSEIHSHWELFIYLNILLQCLHSANRLHYEIEQVRAILAQYDTQFQPHLLSSRGSMRVLSSPISPRLLSLLLLSLRFTYRDLFSQALSIHSSESQVVAKKYKALLIEDHENSQEMAIQRFFSVANEKDLEHINTFLRFIEEKFPSKSTLPSYCMATREIWLEYLLESTKQELPSEGDEGEWLRGYMRIEHKVSSSVFSSLAYLSSSWTSIPKTDRSLIALSLHIHPRDLCIISKSQISNQRSTPNIPIVRSNSSSFEQPFDLFNFGPSTSSSLEEKNNRKDLISEYAAKGVRLLGKGLLRREGLSATQMAARKRLDDRMRRMAETQRDLQREVISESSFLSELGSISERPRGTQDKSLIRGMGLDDSRNPIELVETGKQVQEDLKILSRRVENFTKLFDQRRKRSSIDSANTSIHESMKEEDETESEIEKREIIDYSLNNDHHLKEERLEIEDEEETFEKKEVDQIISSLPPIERLDLSQLSPPPTVGRRMKTEMREDSLEDREEIGESPLETPSYENHSLKGSISERSARRQRKLGRIEVADRMLEGRWNEGKKRKELKRMESWMRLIPLGNGVSSQRIPLLKVDEGILNRKSKSSRGVQTSDLISRSVFEMKGYSRPDSGIDGSPSTLPSIPFIRTMSKDQINQMLSDFNHSSNQSLAQ